MNDTTVLGEDLKEDIWGTPTNIIVVVMLSVFSVVGVVGNAIVIYIFFRRRNSSTSVIFILALAGTDFITCLVTIPYTIVHELLRYDLVFDLACKTYMFLNTSTVPFSSYIMVGIALDRYFCICHPFLYVVTIRRAKAIIFCMSIPALTFGILTALMHGTYVYREKHLPNITKWFNVSDDDIASQHTMLKEMYRVIPPIPGSRLDTIYTHPSSSRGDTRGGPTNYTTLRFVDHIKTCVRNDFVFSDAFVNIYTKIHAAGFVLAYIIVAVLYILIYKAIYTRRANKAKRKKKNMYPLLAVAGKTETTQLSMCINGGPTTSVGSVTEADNEQKPGPDQLGARKIVLTARDDAGILPVTKTAVVPMGNRTPREELRQGSDNVEYLSTPKRENGAKSEEKNAEENQEMGVISSQEGRNTHNGNTAQAPTLLLEANNPAPDEHERRSVNERREEEAEEEEEGSHLHTPLMLSVNNAEAQSTATYLSTNSLVSLQSPSHSRNTLHQQQQQHQQQQLDASLNNNSRKEGQGGNNATSPSVVKDATSTSVLPAEAGTTSQTITITFNHVKSTETKHKSKHLQTDAQLNSIKRKRQSTLRHRNLVANIKTAFMLFIVTLVFIIAFLPALLMTQGVLPLNLIAFYVYYVYNVANPFIYAFMNQTFREDLKKIVNILCSR